LGEVLQTNHVKEGCARIYAVYNQVGFWRSDEDFPPVDLIIYSADLPAYSQRARLGVREQGRHAASPLAGVKVTSWLMNVWSLQEAQRGGFDEVVMLNERGEVAECTAANVFCVKSGRVATPPLSSGCLEGITRGVLLEVGAPAGVPVEEKTLLPQDLYTADEVFISSTNRNLLPVSEIAGRRIGNGSSPIADRLEKVFENYVRKYLDSWTASASKR
jgi:branched-chain amino acid aminotransferase